MTTNADIVRHVLLANRSGPPQDTVEAAVAVSHPDVEFVSRVTALDGTMYRGHAGIRRYFSDFAEVFDEWHNEVQQVEELRPDVVIAEIEFRAVGKGSGLPVELRTFAVVALSDGKLIRIDTYAGREEALEAIESAG